ncbi:MAG: GTP 3',8-cyclase MoaA [Aquabacterium sp.]|nr:GTP 3',8-cyclase MoaA [Aquabacterium sp.]
MAREALIDQHGRAITYLRLSVTDKCNYRCVYCMAEDMQFMPRDELMSLAELATIATAFVDLGVRKIRLTGGEPLVRPGVLSLVAKLASLPGLDELTLTTNGAHLHKLAQPLKQAGLSRINISLDSLQPDRFKQLTRTGKLTDVLAGIRAAQDAGFTRIKLNSVILRDRNDDEVIDLVDFARAQGLDIAFIEEMPLGVIHEHDRAASFVSSAEILSRIGTRYPLTFSAETSGGPARFHRMADSSTRIGVISPHSANFCSTCNRVRVTADGRLMLCLGNDDAVDLGSVLRAHPHEPSRLKEAIKAAIQTKPERHHFRLDAPPQIIRFMSATGG